MKKMPQRFPEPLSIAVGAGSGVGDAASLPNRAAGGGEGVLEGDLKKGSHQSCLAPLLSAQTEPLLTRRWFREMGFWLIHLNWCREGSGCDENSSFAEEHLLLSCCLYSASVPW